MPEIEKAVVSEHVVRRRRVLLYLNTCILYLNARILSNSDPLHHYLGSFTPLVPQHSDTSPLPQDSYPLTSALPQRSYLFGFLSTHPPPPSPSVERVCIRARRANADFDIVWTQALVPQRPLKHVAT